VPVIEITTPPVDGTLEGCIPEIKGVSVNSILIPV
jgi:hypothetical protein